MGGVLPFPFSYPSVLLGLTVYTVKLGSTRLAVIITDHATGEGERASSTSGTGPVGSSSE